MSFSLDQQAAVRRSVFNGFGATTTPVPAIDQPGAYAAGSGIVVASALSVAGAPPPGYPASKDGKEPLDAYLPAVEPKTRYGGLVSSTHEMYPNGKPRPVSQPAISAAALAASLQSQISNLRNTMSQSPYAASAAQSQLATLQGQLAKARAGQGQPAIYDQWAWLMWREKVVGSANLTAKEKSFIVADAQRPIASEFQNFWLPAIIVTTMFAAPVAIAAIGAAGAASAGGAGAAGGGGAAGGAAAGIQTTEVVGTTTAATVGTTGAGVGIGSLETGGGIAAAVGGGGAAVGGGAGLASTLTTAGLGVAAKALPTVLQKTGIVPSTGSAPVTQAAPIGVQPTPTISADLVPGVPNLYLALGVAALAALALL